MTRERFGVNTVADGPRGYSLKRRSGVANRQKVSVKTKLQQRDPGEVMPSVNCAFCCLRHPRARCPPGHPNFVAAVNSWLNFRDMPSC